MVDHGWRVMAASIRGAQHERVGAPSGDAWGSCAAGGVQVVAVADGHGHRRHFRSDRGSDLAADAVCAAALPWATGLAPTSTAEDLAASAARVLVPEVVHRWREAVDLDVALDPFTAEDEAARAAGDQPAIAYGTTLLAIILVARWAVLARIGDGDLLLARTDGSVVEPLPADRRLAGDQTTSLCQPDAVDAFRIAVIDVEAEPLALMLVATDGYGNAQTADPWQPGVGRDMVALIAEHGAAWLEARLPGWVGLCASTDGSGDDTTVALVVRAS